MTNIKAGKSNPKTNEGKPHTAIMLIDVMNDLSFPKGEKFKKSFALMSQHIEKLLSKARKSSIPIIYVNDNWGKWRSDRTAQLKHVTRPQSANRNNVLRMLPEQNDYYILKPKHSAFYASPTDLILKDLGVKKLILCGISAESCILFTATDAYLHNYHIILPEDCIASESPSKKKTALALMKESHHARVVRSTTLNFR